MNLAIAIRSEMLKIKRTTAFWLSLLGAAFIPAIFFLAFTLKPEHAAKSLQMAPWNIYFFNGWMALNSFLFPMFVILICSLIPQIEYKNNTWKQVFSSPQTVGNIYFSKFITIHLMIFFFYLSFNIFMILSAIAANLIHKEFSFFNHSIDWQALIRLNFKTYVSILGISAIQYWLSLRFKNFIAPIGIGLVLLVGALIARGFNWEHIYKIPYAHPSLTLFAMVHKSPRLLENHELNSIAYFLAFTLLGFLDMSWRKEKG
jgi:hypothetical protein